LCQGGVFINWYILVLGYFVLSLSELNVGINNNIFTKKSLQLPFQKFLAGIIAKEATNLVLNLIQRHELDVDQA
jgi:hypothetical protein